MAKLRDISTLKTALIQGDRIALARAITLIESDNQEDREFAGELLSEILYRTGKSIRIGITGVPGVGKSTFIETLGSQITQKGHKLAVLAIDPTSPTTQGSILGDKTRMGKLAANPNAFIRPSASGGQLGGVTRKTLDSILLCEAAGYDVIFIETVGVGQSEVAVKNMSDVFLLLLLAGAGDELQGIKRGIMEMADVLVINKADGENIKAASLAKKALDNALHLFNMRDDGWQPPVLTCSALENNGIMAVWEQLVAFIEGAKDAGTFETLRMSQKKLWLTETLNFELSQRIKESETLLMEMNKLEKQVLGDKLSPQQAAAIILNKIIK